MFGFGHKENDGDEQGAGLGDRDGDEPGGGRSRMFPGFGGSRPGMPGAAAGGNPQPGGIAGGPGQGPGMGHMGLPWMRGGAPGAPGAAGGGFPGMFGQMRDARQQFHQGLRDRFQQGMQGFGSALGFSPRPGGTAGGGFAWDPSKMQMPPGFAAHVPWGKPTAAPATGAAPAAPAQGVAPGEPNPSAPAAQSGGGLSPAQKEEVRRKGLEIGKRARSY